MKRRQVLGRFGHPFLSFVVQVRGQSDRKQRVLVGLNLEQTQIGPQLINDPSLRQRCPFHVPPAVAGMLAKVCAIGVHRPEVHCSVAIRDEIDPVFPPHRRLAGAGKIGAQRHGFRCVQHELPQCLGRAALVAFGAAALKLLTREVKCAASGIQDAVTGLAEGQGFRRAARQIDHGQLQQELRSAA